MIRSTIIVGTEVEEIIKQVAGYNCVTARWRMIGMKIEWENLRRNHSLYKRCRVS